MRTGKLHGKYTLSKGRRKLKMYLHDTFGENVK
jgi:hypothetical protein